MQRTGIGVFIIIISVCVAGCTTGAIEPPSYSVDESGVLSLKCSPVTTSEEQLISNETYTKTRIVIHTQTGDVITYLTAPEQPRAAVVYAPGAGEKPAGHEVRMAKYAAAGYAFLYIDMRGNGGETGGIRFGPQLVQQDYDAFSLGKWPQYYQSLCDLSSARQVLMDKFNTPVYVMGSSNGGRYAAVAAGTDPEFAGYIGISTSDWGVYDAFVQQGYTGDPVRFAESIEPSTYIARISPRPVWIFHAEADSIIPFSAGKALADRAGEPKEFITFSGSHGINSDTDDQILTRWAQIYGTQE